MAYNDLLGSYDDLLGVDPTAVPSDEEQQRRRALPMMAPVSGRRIGLQVPADSDLPAPLAALVRNPGDLLLAPALRMATTGTASGQRRAPDGANAMDSPNAIYTRSVTMAPATRPGSTAATAAAPTRDLAPMAPAVRPAGAGGYEREPGSGLLLRGRAIAAQRAAQDRGNSAAPLQMAPMRGGNASAAPAAARDLNTMAGIPVSGTGAGNDGRILRQIAAERPDPNAPQYQPRKQGILRRILTGFAMGAASGNPAVERALEERVQQRSGARDYQSDLADWRNRLNDELKIEQAERGEHPNYQFQNIGGRIKALDPRSGKVVQDLGPAGTRSKLSKVGTDAQGNAIAVFDDGTTKPLGYKVGTKPDRATNPFEAFAYGTPQERRAAQDFLSFEKKIGAQYERPDEVEERYQLYKSDPEAYKAMFGNRGGAQDQAQAARMLNYFQRERRRIEDDWTLDEPTRAQRLNEIDQLEAPYLNAAAPSGGAAGQGGADRVTVVSPKGVTGTIPRSQLKAAQGKGYRLAQ